MKALSVLVSTLIVAILAIALASSLYGSFQRAQLQYSSLSESRDNRLSPIIFENATNLTNNPMDSVYGQIAAWNNNVYMLWQDSVPPGYRNYDIFIKSSSDGGTTFGTPINLSNNSGFSEHPQIAAYNNKVYAIWADDSSGNREVLFTRSEDNGNTFDEIDNLSNNTSDSFNQEVAVFGDNVYVVWLDQDKNDNTNILLKVSSDGGATFGSTMNISSNANQETFPKISAYGDNVYIAWNMVKENLNERGDQGLFFVRSLDGGKTFGNVIKLNQEDNFGEVQVAAYNETVYVVSGGLHSFNVDGILFTMSTDRGGSFSQPITIDGNGTLVDPQNVEVNAYNGQVSYISTEISVSGNEEIVLLEMDGGNPTRLVNLSNNAKVSECSSIAVTNNNIYVVWEDMSPGNHEILYAKGTRA
ncbi:MAG: glycoside hydrolase [Thermoproteota archaeon]|nr:glycoside hydrolase [Thermoproteota archaeon]